MKRSTINFALTLVMAMGFAVSCGKDSKSSSAPVPVQPSTSLITSGNISAESQSAVDSFNTWYNNGVDNGLPQQAGIYSVKKLTSTLSNNGNCEQKTVLKVIKYWVCGSSSSSSNSGTPSYANVTISSGSGKGNNQVLTSLVNGSYGTVINATFNGQIYSLQIQKSNGHVATYTIDIAFRAELQPVMVTDSESNNLVVVRQIVSGANQTNF